MNRRDFVKLGLLSSGGAVLASSGGLLTSMGIHPSRAFASETDTPDEDGSEPMPLSPLVLSPFSDPLPIPKPLATSDIRTWQELPNPKEHQMRMLPAACYRIQLKLGAHDFTSSLVRRPTPDGGWEYLSLPASTIYGFNGQFPGPMIRAQYGKPLLVRFENHLDENPDGLDRGDFGVPEFLTHLHNGHTAPESDGNPHHRPQGYGPGEYCDNLYLNWPAGGDDREKQSFCWYHDHRMDNTSSNVYKGMVGLYPLYDAMDCGDETRGYRLPGFNYDIPLAIYDCRLDDGVTPHKGIGQDGIEHPENWGRLFFSHYPNHGFVGDVFTVNGKVQPYLVVKRRKYRFRFLDCSVSRWYEFSLMTGTPQPAPGVQGQWLLAGAEQAMRLTQIASDGGLLPRPFVRDSFIMAPAKRKEIVVDFTKYIDGSQTRKGDVIYLANTLAMSTGRKPDESQPSDYAVPILKFIIGDDAPTPDYSLIPPTLRSLPPMPDRRTLSRLTTREFELHRSNGEWMINGERFDPFRPLAYPRRGSAEVWILRNGSGGWVHPLHIHQEEHRVISRNGENPPREDVSKEDVVALEPNEEVVVYRKFRSFTGKYVTHCHNLSHEDHAMMFAWTIVP